MKKKTIASVLSLILAITCTSGCANLDFLFKKSDKNNEIKYESIMASQETKKLAPEESVTYNINKDISGKEYIKFLLKSDVNLLGKYVYCNVKDNSEIIEEEFFIEGTSDGKTIEFKQFFDSFRPDHTNHYPIGKVEGEEDMCYGSPGRFDKILKSITLTNKSEKIGEVTVEDFSVSDRTIPEFEKEIYIESGVLKVGADLSCGGILTYLERTNYNGKSIDEVVDFEGNVYIGVDAKSNAMSYYSSNVNLINTPDPGRQFQQSYYANVGGVSADTADEVKAGGYSYENKPADYGMNGYERGWCKTAGDGGHYWPYNPVQGGNMWSQPSQIIDYSVSDTEIYVKVRAMDWAKKDIPTKSYMENWYTIKNNMVYVTNRFIDWNGFTDMESVLPHNNELPAAYVVHPLNNYVCYTGNNPWTDDELTIESELGFWGITSHQNSVHKEDWFAWVNDDLFGVGVYIPNVEKYVSGRIDASTSTSANSNSNAYSAIMANDLRYNKREVEYPYMSCYVGNTDYTAPVKSWTMKSYQPMTYQYVMAVDYLNVMRSKFYGIYSSGEVKNEMLDVWR